MARPFDDHNMVEKGTRHVVRRAEESENYEANQQSPVAQYEQEDSS